MLTQSEADALIAMEKRLVAAVQTVAVAPGGDESYELAGAEAEERFQLDLYRGRRRTAKLMFQTRARKVVVLLRLDLNGSPHTNPDGERLDGTHLHVFREDCDDKWALPLSDAEFRRREDAAATFADFCRISHIEDAPVFQETLL